MAYYILDKEGLIEITKEEYMAQVLGENTCGPEQVRESGLFSIKERIDKVSERINSNEIDLRNKTDQLIGPEEVSPDKLKNPKEASFYGNGIMRELVQSVECLEASMEILSDQVRRYERSNAF